MRYLVLFSLVAVMGLSACQSRWNPANWFGNSEEVAVENAGEVNPLIPQKSGTSLLTRPEEAYPGIPVDRVTELKVEQTADGAIIRASGIAFVQGAFDVALRPLHDGKHENGVLTYELLAIHPSNGVRGGPERTREVHVAHSLTEQQLAGVRTIKVVAFNNARQARR